jgi:hypothetical protein
VDGYIRIVACFFSFVFWKLDQRTRQLIKHAEIALSFLDSQYDLPDLNGMPHPLRLFSREGVVTSTLRGFPLTTGHFSYARCFRWVFFMFSIVGVALTIFCLLFFHF